MALPTYDKSKRKKQYQALPKGAYVVIIKSAKEETSKKGKAYIRMAIDIAEGEYKDFYLHQFESNTNEDKKWNNDAVFNLSVPDDSSPSYVWDTWNSFFADLEDSNNGFVFTGTVAHLKNKIIGGKFHIEQSEFNNKIYNHTRMKWSCVAEDVRKGTSGAMPQDKLIQQTPAAAPPLPTGPEGFVYVPDDSPEEIPF